jgi:hypothetical protein
MPTEHLNLLLAAAGFLLGLHFAPPIVLAFVIGYVCHAALRKPRP